MLAIGNSHIKLPNPEWAMGCGACNSWFCFAAFRVFSTMTWWSHFGKVDTEVKWWVLPPCGYHLPVDWSNSVLGWCFVSQVICPSLNPHPGEAVGSKLVHRSQATPTMMFKMPKVVKKRKSLGCRGLELKGTTKWGPFLKMRTWIMDTHLYTIYTCWILLEMHVLNSLGKITPGVGPVNFGEWMPHGPGPAAQAAGRRWKRLAELSKSAAWRPGSRDSPGNAKYPLGKLAYGTSPFLMGKSTRQLC